MLPGLLLISVSQLFLTSRSLQSFQAGQVDVGKEILLKHVCFHFMTMSGEKTENHNFSRIFE